MKGTLKNMWSNATVKTVQGGDPVILYHKYGYQHYNIALHPVFSNSNTAHRLNSWTHFQFISVYTFRSSGF